MDPCVLDPTSPGCPMDPCFLNPTSTGCPEDPCILDPMSQGCPMDPCVLDPNGMECICRNRSTKSYLFAARPCAPPRPVELNAARHRRLTVFAQLNRINHFVHDALSLELKFLLLDN